MNGYDLSRNFWDFSFDNPEKITPNHCAIYLFALEHCNRLGWREKFGFPTMMVCDAVGIKKASTYIRYFNDLVDWGFFELLEKSTNQYSANIIRLTSALPKNGKALDKAIMNHRDKQTISTGISKVPVDKQLNNQQPTTKQPTTKKPKELKFFSEDIENCFNQVLPLFDENIQPKTQDKINDWKDEIRKIIDLDKIDANTIVHVVRLARADDFWKSNFQSLLKLRKTNKEGVKYILYFINKFKDSKDERRQQISNLASELRKQFPNL